MGKKTKSPARTRPPKTIEDVDPMLVECPHLHFKEEVVNRDALTHEQRLNLLATPKGYRWRPKSKGNESDSDYDDASDSDDGRGKSKKRGPKRIVCGRPINKPEKTYIHNFLAEIWALLTPEMIDRLKGMLMNEFGMSPEQAEKFIMEQREKSILKSSTVSLVKSTRTQSDGTVTTDTSIRMRKPKGPECDKTSRAVLGIRNRWVKDFSKVVSAKLTDYIVTMMCRRRTKRQWRIADTILKHMNDLLGEKATLQSPQTQVQRVMVFTADRLAFWLSDMTEEAEKARLAEERRKAAEEAARKEREKAAKEQGGKGDGKPDSKSSSPKKSSQASKQSSKPESAAGTKPSSAAGSKPGTAPGSKPASKGPSEPGSKPGTGGPGSKQASGPGSKAGSKPGTAPGSKPASKPTSAPTSKPATAPSSKPQSAAQSKPGSEPSSKPGSEPSSKPGSEPSSKPGSKPSSKPGSEPSSKPGSEPSSKPGSAPTSKPGSAPPSKPQSPAASQPTSQPASAPSSKPTTAPSSQPESQTTSKKPSQEEVTEPGTDNEEGVTTTDQVEPEEKQGELTDDVDKIAMPDDQEEGEKTQQELDEERKVEKVRSLVGGLAEAMMEEPIDKTERSPRQENLEDVLEKKLLDQSAKKDPAAAQDKIVQEAAREAARRISNWMDKQVAGVEAEYGEKYIPKPAVEQKGKGPVFALSGGPPGESGYGVKPLNPLQVKQKILAARAAAPPPDPSQPPPNDPKDWAKWAIDVVSVAEKWASWIDKTCADAEDKVRRRREGQEPSPDEWQNWQDTTQDEALEWRRNKQLAKDGADNWAKRVAPRQ